MRYRIAVLYEGYGLPGVALSSGDPRRPRCGRGWATHRKEVSILARKKRRSEEAHDPEEPRSPLDRLSLGLTLVVVSVFAIFTGYLVGQYAIRWVASPLGETPQAVDSGVQLQTRVETTSGTQSASATAPSQTEGAGGTPSATSGAATSTSSEPRANSSQEMERGSAQSLSPTTERERTTVVRVQVGRYSTREAANETAERLRTGSPPIPDAWVLFDQESGEYRVQAGAFSSRERADELVRGLRARSFDAFVAQ